MASRNRPIPRRGFAQARNTRTAVIALYDECAESAAPSIRNAQFHDARSGLSANQSPPFLPLAEDGNDRQHGMFVVQVFIYIDRGWFAIISSMSGP
jgi:hypothetical protein